MVRNAIGVCHFGLASYLAGFAGITALLGARSRVRLQERWSSFYDLTCLPETYPTGRIIPGSAIQYDANRSGAHTEA